jgi:hypothetical protein
MPNLKHFPRQQNQQNRDTLRWAKRILITKTI